MIRPGLRPLLIGLPVLLLAACGGQPPATAPTAAPIAVSTIVSASVERPGVETLPATVRAARAVAINARLPGVVAAIAAEPGTSVAAGAILVRIDAAEVLARRDAARAGAEQAATDLRRAEELAGRGASTPQELDGARARARAATAAAAEAEAYAGYLAVTAPFAGVVVRRNVALGDLVAPGRPLVELEDPASLRLEVAVPESLAAPLAVGTVIAARIEAAGWAGDAPIVEITPAADAASRTVLVKLALPADLPRLRSGQFGRVRLSTAPRSAVEVPATAVIRRGQLELVFTVTDGRAALRLVRTAAATDGAVAIRAGLAAGETVVVAGAERLVDGQPVTVRP